MPALRNTSIPWRAASPLVEANDQIQPLVHRARIIETTGLEDGNKRFMVVDLVEGSSANKHSVFKVRTEADAVCST